MMRDLWRFEASACPAYVCRVCAEEIMTEESRWRDRDGETCLVLMFKSPARSKRRLEREIGRLAEQAAAHLAACAIEDAAGWFGGVCFAPAAEADRVWMTAQVAPDAQTVMQQGANLGARIEHVNRELLASGVQRQIFIGIDCPELDRDYLARAAQRLRRHDVVLGPAHDGGVVLMGARGAWPALAGLPWSSGRLFAALLALCGSAGMSVATLEPRADIDSLDDLLALKDRLNEDGRPARRALHDWLRELDLAK